MVSEKLLRKYAKLAVCTGANVQKNQLLVITANVRDYRFVEMCVEEAYAVGAGKVMVDWSSEANTLQSYLSETKESLTDIPQWVYDKRKDAQDRGCCYLHISSATPGLLKDVDTDKIVAYQTVAGKMFEPLRTYTMANHGQWSIVALPSLGWAKKVFPDKSDDDAVQALWDAILMSVRVSEDNDPVEEWKKHNETLAKHNSLLNELNFKELNFKNSLGTDVTIELVEGHIWAGGVEKSTKGVYFNPNMPTEETFTMPHKNGVNGKIVATKPLSYQGKVIDEFWLEFEDGKVVNYGANKEYDSLKSLIEYDEGSCRLGEVALISYDSPINNTGILFFNTLYDENASCHVALGAAYPMNLKDGTTMSKEELSNVGANVSMTHVDFMFGSEDMHIEGIKEDGTRVVVFDQGNFVI